MFDLTKLNITEEDIAFVEKHFGFRFNEGQKKIIRFWNSTDIQACPGSGKTTTLAAKLIILTNKIPKSFKQGICIITHTNVAVEEIKHKLGSYSSFYSNYPNHFGTIQSVVDKFFTIPAFKNEFKQSPNIIDTETYCKEINKFRSLNGTALFLSANGIDEIGYLSYNKNNFDISKSINDVEAFNIPRISPEKMATHYQRIKNAKDKLFEGGYIKYEEAYSLAFKYLRENSNLNELFSMRFPFVFIDEMQDMETHQSELISLLCDNTPAIVQKIGDINQSIYNYSSHDIQNEWKPKINADLQLTESTRVSENIATLIKDICISPQEMSGWNNPNPLNPTIIVFDNDSILNVKDKFGELLILNGMQKGGICKAIGARLSDSRLNINSYWNEFNRVSGKKDFSNISSFLENIKLLFSKSKNVKELRNSFLNVLCKCLKLCKIKNPVSDYYFTPFTLSQYLNLLSDVSLTDSLNLKLSNWVASCSDIAFLKSDIENYTVTLIALLGGQVNAELKDFFTNSEIEIAGKKFDNRVYSFSIDGQKIDIHFDTIHGVKGETHQATLYLETFNYTFDIGNKILDFIISTEKQKIKQRKDGSFKRRLPLAYVAMTRATHFICLAVHKDRFTENYEAYFTANEDWNVVCL